MAPTVLISGDSYVAGVGDPISETENRGWARRLKDDLAGRATVEVRGVSGNTVRDLAARFEAETEETQPDFVLYALGINDSRFRGPDDLRSQVPIEEFETTWRHVLARTFELGAAKIVLNGVPRIDEARAHPRGRTDRAYRNELAERYDAVLAGFAEPGRVYYLPMAEIIRPGLDPDILGDGLHPTPAGHEAVKDAVKTLLLSPDFLG